MALSAPLNLHVEKVRRLVERVLADLYDLKSYDPKAPLDLALQELATVEHRARSVKEIVFPKAALWVLCDKIIGDLPRPVEKQRVTDNFKTSFDSAVKRFSKQYRFQYPALEPRDEPELQLGPISNDVYEKWFEQLKAGRQFRTFVEHTHRKYKAAKPPAKPPSPPPELMIENDPPTQRQFKPPSSFKRRKASQENLGAELKTLGADLTPEIANFVTNNAAWLKDANNHFELHGPIRFLSKAITRDRCYLLRMPRSGSGDGLHFCNPLDDENVRRNGALIEWAENYGLFNVEHAQIFAWTSDPLKNQAGMSFGTARNVQDLVDLTRQQHTRVSDESLQYPMRLAQLGIYPGGKGAYNVIWFFVSDAPREDNRVVADLFREAGLELTKGAVRCPSKTEKYGFRLEEVLRNAWNSLCGAKYNFGPGIAGIAHSHHPGIGFNAIMLTERLHETLSHRIHGMWPLEGPTAPSYNSIIVYLKKLQHTIFQMSRNRILFIDGKPENFMDNQDRINLFLSTDDGKLDPSNVDVLAVDLDYAGARRLTDFDNCPAIEDDNSVNFVWAYNMLYVGCWLRFAGVSYDKILSHVWYDQRVKDAIAAMINADVYSWSTNVRNFIDESGWHQGNYEPLSKANADAPAPPSNRHDMETVGKVASYYAQYYFLTEKLKTMRSQMMFDMASYAKCKAYNPFVTNYEERQLPMVLFMLHVYEHITKRQTSVVYMMHTYMNATDAELKTKFEKAIVPRGEITQMLQSWQSVDQNTKEQYVTRMLGKLHFV